MVSVKKQNRKLHFGMQKRDAAVSKMDKQTNKQKQQSTR